MTSNLRKNSLYYINRIVATGQVTISREEMSNDEKTHAACSCVHIVEGCSFTIFFKIFYNVVY